MGISHPTTKGGFYSVRVRDNRHHETTFFTTISIELKEVLVEEYSNIRRGVMGTIVGESTVRGRFLWSNHSSYLEGVSKQVRSYPFHSLTTYSIKVYSLVVYFG